MQTQEMVIRSVVREMGRDGALGTEVQRFIRDEDGENWAEARDAEVRANEPGAPLIGPERRADSELDRAIGHIIRRNLADYITADRDQKFPTLGEQRAAEEMLKKFGDSELPTVGYAATEPRAEGTDYDERIINWPMADRDTARRWMAKAQGYIMDGRFKEAETCMDSAQQILVTLTKLDRLSGRIGS